jgi:glutamate formiminotransferase/glutamate formiminotransferase/formiminotetrahydrofolate cyclodeaminase
LTASTLLAVPNVSEGRDEEAIRRIGEAFSGGPGVRLLDVHRDPDHHRSVFTLCGAPGSLAPAIVIGAREAIARIDLSRHVGVHPRIGALDIAPIVYLDQEGIGPACAEALVLGDRLGDELGLPVFLYGALGGGRTRADVRRGGSEELARRMAARELRPDFGPVQPRPTAGAVLVGARPPLVAFNVELSPSATLEDARSIAASIREGGADGLPGLRALGVWLDDRGVAQVSMNVEDHLAVPLSAVVEAISRYATPGRAELVGLAPRAALEGFPPDLRVDGAGTIEDALAAAQLDG